MMDKEFYDSVDKDYIRILDFKETTTLPACKVHSTLLLLHIQFQRFCICHVNHNRVILVIDGFVTQQ